MNYEMLHDILMDAHKAVTRDEHLNARLILGNAAGLIRDVMSSKATIALYENLHFIRDDIKKSATTEKRWKALKEDILDDIETEIRKVWGWCKRKEAA